MCLWYYLLSTFNPFYTIGGGTKSESKDGDTAPTEVLGGKLWRMTEEDLSKLIAQGLVYYEREEKDLNMLLFSEILENITHIDRTLSSFRGHLLLVGRAGCYSSLLPSYMHRCDASLYPFFRCWSP